MKKILIFIIGTCCLFYACSENDRMVYDSKPSVYFADLNSGADSVVYSFTATPKMKDTVYFKVKLLGFTSIDREYRVKINPESTAEVGVHYEALKGMYIYPAGKEFVLLPICIMKSPDLDTSIVTLSFRLETTEYLDAEYLNQISGRLIVTNQQVKPEYWDTLFYLYFGEYSKVKHRICAIIMGHDFPLTKEETLGWGGLSYYAYWMHAGRDAAAYFAENEVYDENGRKIEAWEPF